MNVVRNQKPLKKLKKHYFQPLNFQLREETVSADKIINRTLLNELNATTNNQSSTATDSNSNVILALTEGRGQARGEVGIAALDINAPVLILSQLSDGVHYTDTINKIQVLNPIKILIPDTILEQQPIPKLIEIIRENLLTVSLIPVQRRHFNDKAGFELISNLCSKKSDNVLQIIMRKYYSLSAASALISYLKNIALVTFAQNCLKIDYQTKGGMMIDGQTSTRLELLYSLNVDSATAKKFSLYAMLNKCQTQIGQRHLRANILEPSCDIEFILHRQQQIKVLIENEDFLINLKENLHNFRNVESLMKISCVIPSGDSEKALQTNIGLALLLKNCLEAVKPLAMVIIDATSPHFEEYRQLLSSTIFNDIIEQIDNVIQPNIHENRSAKKLFQYLYAVKVGVNETIDFLRKLYAESVDKINDYIDDLTENTLLPLRMVHTAKLSYHMVLKNPNIGNAPPGFELIYRKGINSYLTTPQLITYNEKVRQITLDIICISNSLLSEILLKIAKEIDFIYYLINVIIECDIVQSLAEVSLNETFCCPSFSRVLRLENAYHPMLSFSRNKSEPISNNVIATPQYNFYIITGPNMSGKTVYIKMVAIIQIMAQIGCFVPAKVASLRVCDKLFSRLGFADCIEQNASSFTVELRDMEYIYSNLTPNSLVIIDELCRSTDPQEGEVLCYAFCEKLLNFVGLSFDDYFKTMSEEEEKEEKEAEGNSKISNETLQIKGASIKLKDIARPYIFLTTHFSELAKIADRYTNAVNLHMSVKQRIVEEKVHLDFRYKIQSGPSPVKSYGLALARILRFPSSIIDRADELVGQIEDNSVIPFMSHEKSMNNEEDEDEDVTMLDESVTNTTQEITRLESDVIDLYSYVLLLMSTGSDKQYEHISIEIINEKLRQLIESMSPDLRELLKMKSLDEIIGILNTSQSFSSSQ